MFLRQPRHEIRRRMPQLLVGLVLCGVGVTAMVLGDLGLGPWDVLHQGLSTRLGLPIGAAGILVGFAILPLWIPLRERLGVGTLLNIVLIGLTIDVLLHLLPDPGALALRVLLTLSGPVLLGVGAALYIGAGLGAGPRDGVMTGMARRGIAVWKARTAIELSALAAGAALGGSVGLGTVWFALAVGPVIHHTLERVRVAPLEPALAFSES